MNIAEALPADGKLWCCDVSEQWTAWFGATRIVAEGGESVITVTIQDQSALHGVLNGIRDLGLCLISVQRIN